MLRREMRRARMRKINTIYCGVWCGVCVCGVVCGVVCGGGDVCVGVWWCGVWGGGGVKKKERVKNYN